MADVVQFTDSAYMNVDEGGSHPSPRDDVFYRIAADLAKSGLELGDLDGRPLESPERAATGTPYRVQGYVIPYYDIHGLPVSFYRVKLLDHDPKYKQPRGTKNFIYFPKGVYGLIKNSKYVIMTEGEKKATLAVKLGYPCVGLSGVDSWKTKTYILPGEVEVEQDSKRVLLKSAGPPIEDYFSPLAEGLRELIDLCLEEDKSIVIVYDSDNADKTIIRPQVQRAAAQLGFELRYQGIRFGHIKQLILPIDIHKPKSKYALDDILLQDPEGFQSLLLQTLQAKHAFPNYPNIKEYVGKRLQKSKMSRKEAQAIALALITDLDTNGQRIRDDYSGRSFYFDANSRELMRARFLTGNNDASIDSPFSQMLYQRYGLSPAADTKIMAWVGQQFNSEEPVENATPHRVIHTTDTHVNWQIDDGYYARVSSSGLEICNNGEHGVLFEKYDQQAPITKQELVSAWNEIAQKYQSTKVIPPWWVEVFKTTRLKDKEEFGPLFTLLCYISPFLSRWRGTQLPIELLLGEAGSGKSSIATLRLNIISGTTALKPMPRDIRDWQASISNTGGLHVLDNVQLVDKNFRQLISDELCRLVTEPDPHIEMRRLYTESDLVRIPVECCFCVTAIQMPFQNSDVVQRSIIFELDKMQAVEEVTQQDGHQEMLVHYDSRWVEEQLERFGGRVQWMAHHMYVLHRFFKQAEQSWDRRYQATHRLVNFEQCLKIMGSVVGIEGDTLKTLFSEGKKKITETDWVMQGLSAWVDHIKTRPVAEHAFFCTTIANWAINQEEFEHCESLINPRRLGRFLSKNQAQIATTLSIRESGVRGNKTLYRLLD